MRRANIWRIIVYETAEKMEKEKKNIIWFAFKSFEWLFKPKQFIEQDFLTSEAQQVLGTSVLSIKTNH